MSKFSNSLADIANFRTLAWKKFNALSLEEQIKMLQEYGIPAEESTVSYYFNQLVEIAIDSDTGLLDDLLS